MQTLRAALAAVFLFTCAVVAAAETPPAAPSGKQQPARDWSVKPSPDVKYTKVERYPDGQLKLTEEKLKGDVTRTTQYDKDGKTVLSKKEVRKDGSVAYEMTRQKDGSTLAIRYKPDGRKQMERRHDPKTQAFTLKHYRTGKSNEVWFTFSSDDLVKGTPVWTYYAKDGTTMKRVVDESIMTCTVYDNAGKARYVQVWVKRSGKFELQSVTNSATNVRYRLSDDGKNTVVKVESLKADGTVSTSRAGLKGDTVDATWLGEYAPSDDPTRPEDETP